MVAGWKKLWMCGSGDSAAYEARNAKEQGSIQGSGEESEMREVERERSDRASVKWGW